MVRTKGMMMVWMDMTMLMSMMMMVSVGGDGHFFTADAARLDLTI